MAFYTMPKKVAKKPAPKKPARKIVKKPAAKKPAAKKGMLFAPSSGTDLEAKVKLKAASAILEECFAPKATNIVAKTKAAHAIIGQVIMNL